ncbi:hypothetical protein QR680_014586 [Steinernema hermaphroditum]|uniref:Mothers against decapentaplegic homolog n=1 Tax=Steinernema hermaphroditum TaxID=289476 RepID=A0AA39IB17_9BILA|nr:hypothetical protein QR680_014586 [Steinernema hermaphroditum]
MMNNLFQFHGPAVKKLLGWKQGDEEEKWAEKAVDSLVKKLKKKKSGQGTVQDLEYALANPGLPSPCVTIPKSLDGRLQVSHRKGLPHVIYCRVWRWPDLQTHHELRPVPDCHYPYDNKNQQHICINPYHYTRIESQAPAISYNMLSVGTSPAPSYSSSSSSSYSSTQSQSPPYFHQQSYYPPSGQPMEIYNGVYSSSSSPDSASSASPQSSVVTDDDDVPMPAMTSPPVRTPPTTPEDDLNYWCSIGYYELNTKIGQIFRVSSLTVVVDGFTDPKGSTDAYQRICLGLLPNVNRNATIENTRKHIGKGIRLDNTHEGVILHNLSSASVFINSRCANYELGNGPDEVIRIPANAQLNVFPMRVFSAVYEQARLQGYVQMNELHKMCFLRLSFVKGWGTQYHRQDITSTPCWIELSLHQPLTNVDQVIQNVQPPESIDVHSYT